VCSISHVEGFYVAFVNGVKVTVIPPPTAPDRIADREQAVHVVLVNRAARHLRVMCPLRYVCAPVFLGLGRNPLVNQRVSILGFVDEMGQPDVVIQSRGLPRHLIRIDADGLRDFAVMKMPVTQTADLDARLARINVQPSNTGLPD
jgi:hypothetical protein